jgi:hypothetical protein
MNDMVVWLRETPAPLVWKAAVAHAWLTHIHPFDDGNGRIARLLANYVLGAGCFPPLIIKAGSERPRYIDALGHSDVAGDVGRLVRLFVRVLNRGVSQMEKPDFARSLFEADLGLRKLPIFDRWLSFVERFFVQLAAQLSLRQLRLVRLSTPSASDFRLLQNKNTGGNGWFARVERDDGGRDILIWVGYVSTTMHAKLHSDQVFPSFFLSERDTNPKALRPFSPSVRGNEPHYDEVCLIPDEDRAVIRRGWMTSQVNITDGAELFASLLAGYLDSMASDDAVSHLT